MQARRFKKARGLAKVSPVILEDARRVVEDCGGILSEFAGGTVVITGAAGFLCSFVLDVLAAYNDEAPKGVNVLALDNFRTGLPERIAHLQGQTGFEFFSHDVTKPFAGAQRADWIVHGASIASPTYYRRYPLETIDANVTGTRMMLDLAHRLTARGYLQLSSSEIYGDPDPAFVPTPEEYAGLVSCTGSRACYDESKRLGETLAVTYHQLYGVPTKTVRPFNVYGPGQSLKDARIIPDMMSAAVENRAIVLFSDGRATRAFCYAADFIAGMFHVLITGAPGEAYNVGNDEEVTIAEAAQTMVRVAASPQVRVEYRPSGDPNYLSDNPQRRCPDLRKLQAATGWRAKTMLAEGLDRTLQSYRAENATLKV